jgi:hypothetical protein
LCLSPGNMQNHWAELVIIIMRIVVWNYGCYTKKNSVQFFDTIGLTNLSNLWSDIVPRVFAIIQSTFWNFI